jgi:hypothetical protein
MNNKSKIAGILSIIAGCLGILWAILIFANLGYAYFMAFMLSLGIIQIVLGSLGIVGGYFAIKNKYWGLALAGSIAGLFTFFPLSIASIILICLGESNFKLAVK